MTALLVGALLFVHPPVEPLKDGHVVGTIPLSVHSLVCTYDWPCHQALAVMRCESTDNPHAYAAGNYGLFQINAIHARRVRGGLDALYDPRENVRVAHEIWREQGWRPWAHCGRNFR